jgi:phage shock protein E
MKRLFYSLLLAFYTTFVVAADHTKDSLETVKKTVAEGKAVLVDVRELDEWNDGHVKNAKHVALSDLKSGKAADKLKAAVPAGKVVYIHCAAGGRCLKAADLLKEAGYDIRPLKPGYDALVKAGFEKDK